MRKTRDVFDFVEERHRQDLSDARNGSESVERLHIVHRRLLDEVGLQAFDRSFEVVDGVHIHFNAVDGRA